MEKAIKLLQLVDKNNFIELYFVSKKIKNDYTIDSIGYLSFEDAKEMADFKNRNEGTNIYGVYNTCVHV